MTNIPNLDCETVEDLMTFWNCHQGGRHAKTLGLVGKDSRRAAAALANYAANKATAQRLRLAGNIDHALYYENICDSIYHTLPEVARW